MQETMQVSELIISMDETISGLEIRRKLHLNNRDYFRLEYLQPALKQNFIEMTIPDKPKSRFQKYRLTAKGIEIKKQLEELKSE